MPKNFGERKSPLFCITFCCKKPASLQVDEAETNFKSQVRASVGRRETISDPFELRYLSRENYEPVAPEVARLELDN